MKLRLVRTALKNVSRTKFHSVLIDYSLTGLIFFLLSGLSWSLLPILGYRAVGFIFIIGVVALGLFSTIGPILFAAALSTLIWNFFFIPPRLTFYIHAAEDIMMCVTYFGVAVIIGLLTSRIKRNEAKLREKEARTRALEESEKLHQAIFSSISHELKTPLTTIIGSATLLGDGSTTSPETQKQVALGIVQESQRLNRVIENLLDMSRLNSGKLKLNRDWHDLGDLIASSIHKVSALASHHQIIVDVPDDIPLVRLDFTLMETALSNIILNAIKYSPQSSIIKIAANSDRHSIYIHVEDAGPGIPKSDLPRIFEKFYRVPGTPSGGMGLGLSIASSIIEAHDGAISVTNLPHRGGARFSVSLSLEEPPIRAPEVWT